MDDQGKNGDQCYFMQLWIYSAIVHLQWPTSSVVAVNMIALLILNLPQEILEHTELTLRLTLHHSSTSQYWPSEDATVSAAQQPQQPHGYCASFISLL